MTRYPDTCTGGCLCGQIRYEVTGAPISVIHCHCETCRRHTGAPLVTLAGYRADQVHYAQDKPNYFASSDGVRRAFCSACGTPLTWEGDGGEIGPMIEVLVATMDRPEDFPPECHIHHCERLPWMDTADTLPRFRVWHDDEAPPYTHQPQI